MPELPEVETCRKWLAPLISGKKIDRIVVRDGYVIKQPEDSFVASLTGKKVKGIERIGKYLFWQLQPKTYMTMHFGLSGKAEWFSEEMEWAKSVRVLFYFPDGILSFTDPRKFGVLETAASEEALMSHYQLGTDALVVSEKTFIGSLKGRETTLKAALLDQQHVAGIGNWLADEICFQSRLHPGVRLNRLSETELKTLFKNMKKVLETAVTLEADWDRFPEWMLVNRREKGGLCPKHKTKLIRETIAGRTTFRCPRCQPELRPEGIS